MRNPIAHCLRALCLVLCGSFLVACGSYELHDDIDLTLNFAPLIGPSDSLHSPYVKGARFHVFVDEHGQASGIASGWRVESANPAVLVISEVKIVEYKVNDKKRSYLQALVVARDEGQTAIIVKDDDGSEVLRSAVEILRPDRIELLAHGALLIERPAEQAVTPAVQVLTGGTATFLARYHRGDRQLFGNGALSAVVPGADVTAEVRQSFLFEDRDWISFTAQREGTAQVELLAGGESISRIAVTGVGEAALGQAKLSQADRVSNGDAHDDELEVVLAETFDRGGHPIYGVTFNWNFGGTPQTGLGDLYRYEFKRGMRRMLSAQHGAMAAALMIEGKPGFVGSTNHIGCATTRRAGAGGAGSMALVLCVGLVLARRRFIRSARWPA